MAIFKKREISFKTVSKRKVNSMEKLFERGKYTTDEFTFTQEKDRLVVPLKDSAHSLYKLTYEMNPAVANAVNNIANFAVQSGYELEGEEKSKNKVIDLIDKYNLDLLLINVIKQMVVFGNSFLEKSTMKLLPVEMMRVVVGKGSNDGEILGYKQVLTTQESIDFDSGEIIHFKWNELGTSFYGTSDLKAVLGTLTRILNYYDDLGEIIHRYGHPIMHWKLGSEEMPAKAADINSFQSLLEEREPGEDLVTTSAVEGQSVISNLRMIQPDGMLKSLENQLIAGLGVPDIFLRGGETSNKSTAEVSLQAFDRKVKAIRMVVSKTLENGLLSKYGVKMSWHELSVQDESKRAEMLERLTNSGVPLAVALKIVGWGSWVDDVKKEALQAPKTSFPPTVNDPNMPPKEGDFKTQAEWLQAYNDWKLSNYIREESKG